MPGCLGPESPEDLGELQIQEDAAGEEIGAAAQVLTLGGIDVDWNCKAIYGASAYAELIPPYGVNNWKCVWFGTQYAINMTQACRRQYDDPYAKAVYKNYKDGYSWVCVTP